ncbi:hypothetical protein QR680_004729 [Steinernema hermaphroditum]|uniref:Uncharacterized protein n=1 Tax=Steinernema hermaphroditum TaxID=289476 RepID=A0AA39HPM4_9BILA|nr:hypothetical protein QR680_004729 [Steinernema hermaphroditum]
MPSDDIEEGTVRVVRRQRRMELRLKRLFADGERCRSVEVRTPDLLNREDPLVRTIGDTMWMNSPHYSEAALEVFNGGYDPVLHAAQPKIESFFDVAYSHFEGTIVDKTNLTMVNPGIVGKYDILLTDPTTNQLRAFYVFHGMAPPGSFNERLRVRMTVNALFRCICTEDPALCMAERGDLLTPEVFEEFRDVYPKLKQMYDRLMDEIELQRERLEREEEQMQQLAEFLQRNPWIAFIVRRCCKE